MKQEEIDLLIGNISNKINAELDKKGFQTGDAVKQLAEDAIKSQIEAVKTNLTHNYVSKNEYNELESKIKSYEKAEIELKSALKVQGEKIGDLIASKTNVVEQIELKQYIADKLKDDATGFKNWTKQNNKTNFEVEIDVKALCCSSGQLSAGTTSVDGTVIALPQTKNSILNLVNIVPTDKPNHEYVEEVSPDGNATYDVCDTGLPVPCGSPKPLIDVGYEFNTVKAEKYASGIAVCDEMLDDYDFLASELVRVINRKVEANVSMAILKLAMTNAAAFQLTGIPSVQFPNANDAITAGCAQVSTMGFEATAVLINPLDLLSLKFSKNENGDYLFNYGCDVENNICCAKIIENNCIPIGHFLVGDFSKINVRPYRQWLKFGHNIDDIIRNKMTMLSERRDIIYIPNNHLGAFVFDSFENVIASFGTSEPLVAETFKVSTGEISPTSNVPYGVIGNLNAPTTYLFVTLDGAGMIKSVATETTTGGIDGAVYLKATELLGNNNASNVSLFNLYYGASGTPTPTVGTNISTLDAGWTGLDSQNFSL